MALTALTALTLTTPPESLAANTVANLGADRVVIDVSSAGTSALLHRWAPEFGRWVPSAAGAATLPGAAGVYETRWEIGGVVAQYCLLCDAAGTWVARSAQ